MGRQSYRTRLIGVALVVCGLGAIGEGLARLVFAHKGQVLALLPETISSLHTYQEPDPGHPSSWRLRAGFVEKFSDLEEGHSRGSHSGDEVFIRINADGFRGPEIDRSRWHRRIVAIGDSCTFGTIEASSYPRVVERALRERGDEDVEVVNAGVEGYSPRDVLYQIDRYKALRPSIVTIYIGWGSLYTESHALATRPSWLRLDSVRLVERGFGYVWSALQSPAVRARLAQTAALTKKRPDADAPELRRLDGFVPTFMGDVEEITRELRPAGITVVLITLPGLYTLDAPPSEAALRIGNMPTFTDNPYVLAKMAERYNAELRALGLRERLPVIDLDQWSRTALIPRDQYFANAVHLTEAGQEMAGHYIAGELVPLLGQIAKPTQSRDLSLGS